MSDDGMAEPSRPPTALELIAAFVDQGRDLFTYADLNGLFKVDVQTPAGRAVFYGVRNALLREHQIWLENVSSQGYRVVRDGPMIQRAARRVTRKRVERKGTDQAARQRKLQRQQVEKANRVRQWRARLAQRESESARPAEAPVGAEPPGAETAREWVDGRRGLPATPRELPRLELGQDALDRVTQAALAQVYREVARTLVEMAEQYAVLAEQTLAGVK